MKALFENEQVYQIQTDNVLSLELSSNQLIICRKADLENGIEAKLQDILNALNWEPSKSCDIISLDSKQSIGLNSLKGKNENPLVISFGLSAKELSIQTHFPNYVIQKFENCTLIQAESLTEIMKDKQKKVALWNVLKNYKL